MTNLVELCFLHSYKSTSRLTNVTAVRSSSRDFARRGEAVRHFRRSILIFLPATLMLSLLVIPFKLANASTNHSARKNVTHATMRMISLDSHLPVQTYNANSSADNVNAKFGSRFDFVISPSTHS